MTGWVLIAVGLLLAGIDFEGDFVMQLVWLWALVVLVGAALVAFGPWAATPEQDARFYAVDMDVDAHTPARGAALLGGSATPGGSRAPRGLNSEETDR